MNTSHNTKVPWNLEGERFDKVAHELVAQFTELPLPRSRIQAAIEEGKILLNGASQKINFRVAKNDELSFSGDFFHQLSSPVIFPKGSEPRIIEENSDFLVINKPAGWLTHKVSPLQEEGTLENWLVEKGYLSLEDPSQGRVHRLDRNTSGLILYAKNLEIQESLKALFQERAIQKTYVAVVEDHVPEEEGIIKGFIFRVKGSFKRYIESHNFRNKGRAVETHYSLLARYQHHDLLFVQPKTGRTHQIRAHMTSLRCPIAGDKLYGGSLELLKRQFLHAWSLDFVLSNKKFHFECPLPEDLKSALVSLDETLESRYDNEALQSLEIKQ